MQLDARHPVERANCESSARHGCACFYWLFETICRNAGGRTRHAIWRLPSAPTIEWSCSRSRHAWPDGSDLLSTVTILQQTFPLFGW